MDRVIQANAKVAVVAFSSDSRTVCGVCDDGTIKMWDPRSGSLRRTMPWSKNDRRGATFSPDGSMIASSGQDRKIKLWDIKSGEMKRMLPSGAPWVAGLAFSRDGKLLASG